MSINTKIHITKSMISAAKVIQIEPFYSKELATNITAWNEQRMKLVADVAEVGKTAAALLDEGTGGTCSRPAGVVTDLQKIIAKLPRYRVELINLLHNKRETFTAPIQAAYAKERERWLSIMDKRNAELDNITKGMVQAVAHSVRVTDGARREAEQSVNHFRGKATEKVLTSPELQLLEDLQTGLQDQF
jgi:hypothetical protein